MAISSSPSTLDNDAIDRDEEPFAIDAVWKERRETFDLAKFRAVNCGKVAPSLTTPLLDEI